ncbi:MAG: PSD1 and planctomycete cytochrome C domain-containing protein [Pirellulales bacterium]
MPAASDKLRTGRRAKTHRSKYRLARRAGACTAALLVVAACLAPRPATADEREEFFEKQIRPVLAGVCFRCHGGLQTQHDLRVDSRAALLAGGASGPALVEGDARESLLLKALRGEGDVARMPPDGPLPPAQVAAFEQWIAAGAAWPSAAAPFPKSSHWAFEPVQEVPLPAVQDTAWVQSSVDYFILARQESAGVRPGPVADRRTLIRRATYDLTGLPPSSAEVAAFEADPAPDAFARLVDRLLHSPRYGEQWGRHWLDLVRYADTAGENTDHPLPHAWRYRNWVIDALNRNLPYDEFLREQVAGDLLALDGPAEGYADRVVATGYLAIARRFGHDIDRDMHLTIEDTIDTLGKSVLGLTIGCARCHDHKFDPLTAADYYGLYGIFASTKFSFPGCEPKQQPRDLVPLVPPGEYAPSVAPANDGAVSPAGDVKTAAQPDPAVTTVPVAYAVSDAAGQNARVHKRGDPADLGDEVPRKFPDVLGGHVVQAAAGSGRRELADWLVRRDNPLTARVFVNRVWQWHFGRGLVATPNDFGTRGAAPTHRELLDHLAIEFVRSGWDVRALHRRIMLSATYQLASPGGADGGGAADGASDAAVQAPPELYTHFSRRRVTAEELRDSLLAASGELDLAPGGCHPFPPESSWSFTQHNPFAAEYETQQRSVYVMQKRNRRMRFFQLFDGADPNASTPLRDVTTVPTQALYFMNDPFVHARSERLAGQLVSAASNDDERTRAIYARVLGRLPSAAERAGAAEFLTAYRESQGNGDQERRQATAWAAYARVLFASNEFLYVD